MKNLRTFLVLLLAIGALPSFACGQENTRRPYRFLIPDGYVGWVKVEFNIKGASPLPLEENYYLFKVPSSGRFQTSSDDEFGLADDEYYYVSGSSRRRLASTSLISSI